MPDEIAGRIRITEVRPAWRTMQIEFKQLQGELRRLDRDYELFSVTQEGETFTLIWKLRARSLQSLNSGRVYQE